MNLPRSFTFPAIALIAALTVSSSALAATLPVTDWVTHNGTSTVTNGGTNSPTFGTADNITVMGAFDRVGLLQDGDFVTLSTTLDLGTRTGSVSINTLNTQLRIGLFNGPDTPVAVEDFPNNGIIFEYTNDAPADSMNRRLIREQTSNTQIAPFVSPVNIGNGDPDAGNDSIQGADIGLVEFVMTLTRNNNAIDITGKIEGTDSVSGNPFLSNFSKLGYVPVATGFSFNRVGFFFGGNVNGENGGTLRNVLVTTNVPEPSTLLLSAIALFGALAARRDSRARDAI